MTGKKSADTNVFVPGLQEEIDKKKSSDQKPTEIVGAMQEENVAIDDKKTAREQERLAEAAETRRARQKKALENVKKQQVIEEGQARFKVEEAARNERFAHPDYVQSLREKSLGYSAGDRKGLTKDELTDLKLLRETFIDSQSGKAVMMDNTYRRAHEVFGVEDKEPLKEEEKKPGFFRRLFSKK